MNFSLSEDHVALRDAAANFLDKEVDLSVLLTHGRTVQDTDYEGLWKKIVELGWPGIVIPEAYSGLGMDYIDLIMIIGEMGRTLAPTPMFGTLAGAWAVERAGSETQKSDILQRVAGGELKLCLALTNAAGETGEGVVVSTSGDGHILNGEKSFVVDADCADKIVVMTKDDAFFVVDRNSDGVDVALLPWRDITRQVCSVRLQNVRAERLEISGDVWPWVRDRLYLVLAAESAAGIAASLADSVTYANERIAFGKPIGAFQAIKHQLAEIAAQSECATAGVQYAAWALSAGDERASLAAAMAQAYASEAYKSATHRNIQVFGAIGFTWEMKNHLFYKRARANSELLGAPRQQREEVVQWLEAGAAA
jgi:alkylation response protein AidB-like acyl-CoA dehydrogenase